MKPLFNLKRLAIAWVVVNLLLAPLAQFPAVTAAKEHSAYVEPGLLKAEAGQTVSVIVTGDSSHSAASAVQRLGGQVTADLWLIDAVAAFVPAGELARLARFPGVQAVVRNKIIQSASWPSPTASPTPAPSPTPEPSPTPLPSPTPASINQSTSISSTFIISGSDPTDGWVTNLRFPVPWDGSTDITFNSNSNSYKLVYPVQVDTGVEQLSNAGGTGVGVAVVDSGVYFDLFVSGLLKLTTKNNFIGQADFVQPTCQSKYYVQQSDHCFTDYRYSVDPYGHGSHVAGTIWNNVTDGNTGLKFGIAPESRLLSVRVLDANGVGSYVTVIQGIQYVVAHKTEYNLRVLNLSLSAVQTLPYFMDPLNRAVEQAWLEGIVVVAAAGNDGPLAETITVPGNDPYVITVGAVDGRRTPGYWKDDLVPTWSASGPTLDGFIKPDVLAPGAQIVSFMENYAIIPGFTARLVQQHPDNSHWNIFFRMSGTSMATAVTSGVVALMLETNPGLTPDQVKYRLMATARQVAAPDGSPAFGLLQQGAGRIWAPDAINAVLPDGNGNAGMDLATDLAAGWGYLDANGFPVLDPVQLEQHYLGPVRSILSDDGLYRLYYVQDAADSRAVLGIAEAATRRFVLPEQLPAGATWTTGRLIWSGANDLQWSSSGIHFYSDALFDGAGKLIWSGGELVVNGNGLYDAAGRLIWSGGNLYDAAAKLIWSRGKLIWSGSNKLGWSAAGWKWESEALFDSAGNQIWSGGKLIWSGGLLVDLNGNTIWSGGELFNGSGKMIWSGSKLIWSGAQLLDSAGSLTWAGGRLIWSGGLLVNAGGVSYSPQVYDTSLTAENLAWAGGKLIWSGGKLIWSGGKLIWSGNSLNWSAAKLIWSGGRLIWSGSTSWATPFDPAAANMQASRWVDW